MVMQKQNMIRLDITVNFLVIGRGSDAEKKKPCVL